MIDSHTHLDHCDQTPAQLVGAADAAGVSKIVTIGMDGPGCRTALAHAEEFPQVFAAVGRHPNSATGFDDGDLAEIAALAAHPRCVAIGETGLDYYRESAPHADQMRAFVAQIELARETDKPLIIHTRAAADDTIAALTRHAEGVRVLLHCFSMPERVEECLSYGWWFSFAGNVTYPNAHELRAAAQRIPLDRLLVETDAPYLTPQIVRKQRNEPAFVIHTAAAVAAERGISYEDFEVAVERTAAELFGW